MPDMEDNTLKQFAFQMNEVMAARIELEAMLAENRSREMRGESLAYGEDQIMALQDTYGLGFNRRIDKVRAFQ